MKKFLIIGEGRAKGSDLDKPAWSDSRAARELWSWFEMTEDEFIEMFVTTNVGDDDFKDKLSGEYKMMVLVGRRAEKKILGTTGVVPRMAGRHLVLPHPSGRNRNLNDPKLRERCKKICRRVTRKMKKI